MNEALIKRIDAYVYKEYDEVLWRLLEDCRAALTKNYVPMTYDEMFSATNGLTVDDEAEHMRGIKFLHEDNFVDYARIIESLVILRAGLEVAND